MFRDAGRLDAASACFAEARDLLQALADEHPSVDSYRADLARALHNLGLVQRRRGRFAEALDDLERGRSLRKSLADAHPELVDYRNELVNSENVLGLLSFDMGRVAEAEAAYARARNLGETLIRGRGETLRYRYDLALVYGNLGTLLGETGRRVDAIGSHERARDLLLGVLRHNPHSSLARDALGGVLFNMARWHAEALVARPRTAEDPGPLGTLRTDRDEERAIDLLRQAVDAGFRDAKRLTHDPDLDPLRSREDFRRLLIEVLFRIPPFAP